MNRFPPLRMTSLLATVFLPLFLFVAGAPVQAACDPTKQCCAGGSGGGATCGGTGVTSQGNTSNTNQGAGNPINVITGNKYQQEVDLPALPGVLGLEIVRHYNSHASGTGSKNGILGRGWKLSYETDLYVKGSTLEIVQADGTSAVFSRSLLVPNVYRAASPMQGKVIAEKKPHGTEYTWVWANGRQLNFNADGKLVQIAAPSGEFVSLQRDAKGWLVKVTDPQGRSLHLNYLDRKIAQAGDRFRGVQSIDSPVGRFTYEYGSELPKESTVDKAQVLANLVKVGIPTHYDAEQKVHPWTDRGVSSSSLSRIYHYEDARFPTLLTGISIIGQGSDGKLVNQRLSTWHYDDQGRANLSVKGEPARVETNKDGKPVEPRQLVPGTGIEQVTLQWPQKGQTLLTNSQGQQTIYKTAMIAGEPRILEVRGPGCATCGPGNVRYGYDRLGRLTEETTLDTNEQPLQTTRTELDGYGRPLVVSTITYRNGKPQPAQWRVRYEYAAFDEQANPALQPGADPMLITRPSVVPGREHRIRMVYNDRGQPVRVTESGFSPASDGSAVPIERSTTYRYQIVNGRSVLAEIDGPLKNGPKNNPADSDITRLTWDSTGSFVTAMTVPGNMVTEALERDKALRLTKVRASDGVHAIETRTAYNHTGRILTLTQHASFVTSGQDDAALQRSASFTYDALDRLTGVINPDRSTWRTEYDAAGHPVALLDARGDRIASRFDTEGRLVAVIAQDARGQLLNGMLNLWDGQGNLRARLMPDGLDEARGSTPIAGESVRFDGLGQASAIAVRDSQADILAADGTTRHLAAGRAGMMLTDGGGRSHGILQDDFGRTVLDASPDEGRISFRYGDNGVEKRHIARDGNSSVTERLEFSANGHLLKRILAGCTETLHYEGDLLARLDGCGNRHVFTRDAFGQITAHVQTLERDSKAGSFTFVERYAYDPATGQLTERRLPDGQRLGYRYDAADGNVAAVWRDASWLAWIDHHLGQRLAQGLRALLPRTVTEQAVLSGITYRPFGDLTALVHGNGVREQALHDRAGRLTALDIGTEKEPGAIEALRYRYDGARNIAAVVRNKEERRYRYDGMHRLSGETGQAAAQQVATRVEGKGAPAANDASYSYDPLGRRRGESVERDGFGRQSARGGQRLVYDDAHRLLEVVEDGKRVARYRYDALGNRIAKTVNGHTTYYLYDTAHQLVAEADEAGQVRTQYLYAGYRPYAVLKAAGNGQARELYAIHADHRGLPLSVTDAHRHVVWQGEFDAFGNVRKASSQAAANDSWFAVIATAHAANDSRFDMPLRMAGQYEDAETGLFYNVHRYYDPKAGRYITPDPLGLAGGADSYAYVGSNPLAGSDPHGLFEIPVAAFMGVNVLPVTDGGHGDIERIAFRQYAEDVKDVRFSQTIIDQIILNNYHSDAATSVLLGTGGQFNFKNHFDNPNDGPMYTDESMSTLTESYKSGTTDWIAQALGQINKNRGYYGTVTKTRTGQDDISLIISSFGQNSHALADFYAHTNWVDSPCRGGKVNNEMWSGTETGYVPNGLGKTTIWDEDVSAKLYSGTVNLTGQPKSCLTGTDIGCKTDKTTHGYWNKDHDTLTPDEKEFTPEEQKQFAEQGLVYWEVRAYDPANPPTKFDSELGKNVVMSYGSEWYGEYGKSESDLKKGDRIYVQQPITNHHRLAMVLAIEHTKKEIGKLYDDATGVKVGNFTLQEVFKMDKAALNDNKIKFDFFYPKNK